jgi:parallel beta-helix repeat protein
MSNSKAMKLLLTLPFILFSLMASAKTYYVSSSSGNDGNSGTSPSSAWQSLNRVNSFYSFVPGDQILFNRGDIFYGQISLYNSGSSSNPITLSAYGTGSNPVINGFSTITSWTNKGGNIWESTNSVSSLPYLNIVVINNVNTPMGRYPNTGFLTYQSHSGSTSITSSSLNGSPNWTGAELVIKKERYVFEKGTIKSQSGSTLNYSDPAVYTPTDGFGLFIQNDTRTLDQQNEWYYNSSTKKLQVYSIGTPNNVQVPSVNNLFSFGNGIRYVTIDNIAFIGSNASAISLSNLSNITIQNCSINFAGMDAITVANSPFTTITNNNINQTNDNGITVGGDCSNPVITYNTLNNIGLFEGMSQAHSLGSLSSRASNSTIQYNSIQNSGYNGIDLQGDNINVKNNFINNSCLIKDDGGGIYISNAGSNRVISNNIVLNSIGTADGTNAPSNLIMAHGIFLEFGTTSVTVSGNSISGCNGAGLFLHNTNDIVVKDNTSYNNGIKDNFLKGSLMIQYDAGMPLRNLQLNNNIFVAKTVDQLALYCYVTSANDLKQFGSADNNYYSRPINDNDQILVQGDAITWPGNSYNIGTWKSYIGKDANSLGSPKAISTTNDLRFEYNATSSNQSVSLDANYIDVRGNSYNGNINLAPYSSAVLIKNGASTKNQPPTAIAGTNQTITLPVNSVYLSGSGTDADGYISSYKWTQISGPSSVNISNSTSPGTNVINLVQGVYKFSLLVTDNNGATGSDVTQITVNAAQNSSTWTANAGPDQSITLPVNSVSLTGSSTDPNTYISSYLWTKIAGPAGGNVPSATSKTISLTGLNQGVYTYQVQITDNSGTTSTAKVNVTVNTAQNLGSWTANAGPDQTITLPTNSVSLTGSTTDPNTYIGSYLWTKISGPAGGNVSNNALKTINITGLNQGVYTYQLQITDNYGTISTASVNVTVNAAQNFGTWAANAGLDQTITLPTNSVSLTGSSTDPNTYIGSYVWTKISGPTGGDVSNYALKTITLTGLTQGVYTYQVLITDNKGAISTAKVKVIVYAPQNPGSWKANAGPDQTITLPVNSVSLTGSSTDSHTYIGSYIWTKISGPAGGDITSYWLKTITLTGLNQGVYNYQVQITDNNGATSSANVNVTVNAAGSKVSNSLASISSISTDSKIVATQDSTKAGITTAVQSLSQNNITIPSNSLRVYPNPVRDITTLQINNPIPNSEVVITITDMNGAVVYKKKINSAYGLVQEQINMSGFTNGIYGVSVIFNGNIKQSLKITKL